MISQEEQLELERVVRAAGAELLSFWPGNPSHHSRALDTKSKSDGSLVSQADLASNEILMRGLGRLIPKDLMVFSGISKDIVLASAIDRLEIWSKADYEAFIAGGSADFPTLAEDVMGNAASSPE